ncbi:MAG: GNAT family N-acetyltransferase [Candidatus Asgardarchaeum sp.]
MIQKASMNDAEEILSVINISNYKAYKKIIPKEYFKEPILTLKELLEEFKRMIFYVYRYEGKIVGVAALRIENEESGSIHRVYVLPECQRKGIGTALMKFIETEAKRRGLKKLWLFTLEKAYWAVNFYKKLGYGVTGKVERPWGTDVIMEKALE